jgi:hypothetical protein
MPVCNKQKSEPSFSLDNKSTILLDLTRFQCDCGLVFRTNDVDAHTDQCGFVIPCEHCSLVFPRYLMEEHIDVCTHFIYGCPFQRLGCAFVGNYEQLEQHCTANDVKMLHDKMIVDEQEKKAKNLKQEKKEQKVQKIEYAKQLNDFVGKRGVFKDNNGAWYAGIIINTNLTTSFTVHLLGYVTDMYDLEFDFDETENYEIDEEFVPNDWKTKRLYVLLITTLQGKKIFKQIDQSN